MGSPKLLVFDLDFTLWPFWVDTHVKRPIKIDEHNCVVDASGNKVKSYPEVSEVLEKLKSEGYILAIASRTEWAEGAQQLITLFDWEKYFSYKEMYPGKKTFHFERIKKASGISYSEMIFFDDEQRNIIDIKAIGVKSILVSSGVNKKIVEDAIKSFSKS